MRTPDKRSKVGEGSAMQDFASQFRGPEGPEVGPIQGALRDMTDSVRRLLGLPLYNRYGYRPRRPKAPSKGPKNTSFDPSRRIFLRKMAGWGLMTAYFGSTALEIFNKHKRPEEALNELREYMGIEKNLEALEPGLLKPEDERSGSEILTGTVPSYSPLPLVGGYNFNDTVTLLGPTLATLPEGTKVKITVPQNNGDECVEKLKDEYPHLEFEAFEMPPSQAGLNYMQDVVFATGSNDESGRNIIVGSSLDARKFRAWKNGFEEMLEEMELRGGLDLVSWLTNAAKEEEVIMALHAFGDEALAHKNPEKFDLKFAPLSCEGGDLQPTRLPDGRMGLIVGKMNLLFSLQGRLGINLRDKFVPGERFLSELENIKEDYKKYFGVEEVIVLDEEYLKKDAEVGGVSIESLERGSSFFHSDMVVKTATGADGARVAFITSTEDWGEIDAHGYSTNTKYLRRIRDQFEALGYKIEDMPCTRFAPLNYVNNIMFDHPQEGKTVVLPQYGDRQDEVAAEKYAKYGFKIRKVDMKHAMTVPDEDKKSMGSVHCSFVVLN